jgi:hypothetical protein
MYFLGRLQNARGTVERTFCLECISVFLGRLQDAKGTVQRTLFYVWNIRRCVS